MHIRSTRHDASEFAFEPDRLDTEITPWSASSARSGSNGSLRGIAGDYDERDLSHDHDQQEDDRSRCERLDDYRPTIYEKKPVIWATMLDQTSAVALRT